MEILKRLSVNSKWGFSLKYSQDTDLWEFCLEKKDVDNIISVGRTPERAVRKAVNNFPMEVPGENTI